MSPVTSTLPESGIPADQLAKEAEGPITQHTNMSSAGATGDRSNVTTPGNELPGAFPRTLTPELSPPSANVGETSKDIAQSVYVSAHNTVGDAYTLAQHGIEGAYATAEHAARQFLPTSVVDKLQGVGVLRDNPGVAKDAPTCPRQDDAGNKDVSASPSRDLDINSSATHGGVDSLRGMRDASEVKNIQEDGNTNGSVNTEVETNMGKSHSSPMSEIMPASTHTPIEDPYSILTSNTAHHLKAAPNSGTNPFIVKQPRPTENTQSGTNPFRNAPSATYASPAENTVSTMGTLMSPDRDAKAAAQAMGNITTGTDKDTIAVGAENSVNHETAGEDSKATTNPPRDALQMIGDNIAMNGDNPVDANGDPGVDASVEDGKEDGHARKSSFVQKLKGEAKALAEKMKTKTRG